MAPGRSSSFVGAPVVRGLSQSPLVFVRCTLSHLWGLGGPSSGVSVLPCRPTRLRPFYRCVSAPGSPPSSPEESLVVGTECVTQVTEVSLKVHKW